MNPVYMNTQQNIASIMRPDAPRDASVLALKSGQLVFGKVEEFLANHTAIVQLGSLKLLAHMQTGIEKGKKYWFEVQLNENNEVVLKVVQDQGQSGKQPTAQTLLKHLGLPETKSNIQLAQMLLSKNLPISKEQLQEAVSWMDKKTDFVKGGKAIEWMIERSLPFSKQTFQSLVAVQDTTPFFQQLVQASKFLDNPTFTHVKAAQDLKNVISSLLSNNGKSVPQNMEGNVSPATENGSKQKVAEQPNQMLNFKEMISRIVGGEEAAVVQQMDHPFQSGNEAKQMLKHLVQFLGLSYENEVGALSSEQQKSLETMQTLKPMLLNAMSELGANGKDLEPLIHRLTGMQVISQDINGAIQQLYMQLPFVFGENRTDITLQWSGRRTAKGQMDPDHCRVLLFLELESIQQTVIDLQIQNRVVHVTIINDKKEMDKIVPMFTPMLKEKLEGLGYQLSYVDVMASAKEKGMSTVQPEPMTYFKESYKRVDVKI